MIFWFCPIRTNNHIIYVRDVFFLSILSPRTISHQPCIIRTSDETRQHCGLGTRRTRACSPDFLDYRGSAKGNMARREIPTARALRDATSEGFPAASKPNAEFFCVRTWYTRGFFFHLF